MVTRVQAEDPEGTPVTYRIVSGTGLGLFEIGTDGTITTRVEFDFEGDRQQQYWLTIRAEDSPKNPRHALHSHVHVLVKVLNMNDWAPAFPQPIYFATVPENVPENRVHFEVYLLLTALKL